ncbi:hypothetical protein [Dyadobacter sediminis]|uniref:Uncharacterized protein n=1 Tax=Dyadobacter sediminis TaxID=1493691 RepID=A0A5R9K7K2_9BACT|nr:hypothetical protein [Dyadobacter sediminis]TLU89848.1 hypothetical protein FEM55_20165 [Dyadobacter sediminis]GGC12319.1 hypothetical protein GCM10011325_43950 [Dyadobacter sediminis]
MKKHPVDDLFKHKLSEWEKKPSVSAWEKIQKENKRNRKVISWPWYAAASVVMTLIAGYAVWKYNGNASMPGKGTERLAATVKQMPADPIDSQIRQDSTPEKLAVSEKKSEIRISKKQPGKLQHKALVQQEKPAQEKNIIAVEETELAVIKPEIVPEEIEVNAKTEVKPLPVQTVANELSRTIVIAVETSGNEEDKPKTSKFSRVFRQLKNARAGEQVDWEEIGFNPKSLVAKVDDHLRNGEEKVSEKYHHLKEKTKL